MGARRAWHVCAPCACLVSVKARKENLKLELQTAVTCFDHNWCWEQNLGPLPGAASAITAETSLEPQDVQIIAMNFARATS